MLSIVLANWNTQDLLRQCLASLARSEAGRGAEVIVVDNASADGSAAMLRSEFPQVTVIENAENVGFARANNQGAATASGDLLLLLNTDTEAPEGALEALVRFLADHPDVGIVGPRLVGADGRAQNSCRTEPGLPNLILETTGLAAALPRSRFFGRPAMTWFDHWTTVDVDYVQGACLLIPRPLWDELGGFDEAFFFYAEDADLCRRARERGWRVVFFGDAEVVHYAGASATKVGAKAAIEGFRSTLWFCRKHHGGPYAAACRLVALLGQVARLVVTGLGLPVLGMLGRGRSALDRLRTYWAVCVALAFGDMRPASRRW